MPVRPLTAVAVGSVLAIVLGLAGALALSGTGPSVDENFSLLAGGVWGVAAAAASTLLLARRLAPELALSVGLVAAVVATVAFWAKNGFEPLAALELVFAGALAGVLGTAIAVILAGAARRRTP